MAPRRSARAQAAAVAPAQVTPQKLKNTANPKNTKPKNKSQKTKKGLSGTRAPDSSKPLGRVDPASSLTGNILVEDGCVYDVMLNLVDVSKNSDKYFILQAVEQRNGSIAVFTRWGRTGTAGSCATEKFDDVAKAINAFGKKFEQKTGVSWEDIDTYTPQPKKYLWVQTDHALDQQMWSQNAKWQYWVDDGVDGKTDGWYDFESSASDVVGDAGPRIEMSLTCGLLDLQNGAAYSAAEATMQDGCNIEDALGNAVKMSPLEQPAEAVVHGSCMDSPASDADRATGAAHAAATCCGAADSTHCSEAEHATRSWESCVAHTRCGGPATVGEKKADECSTGVFHACTEEMGASVLGI